MEDSIDLIGVLAWWANPLYIFAITRSFYSTRIPAVSSYAAIAVALLTFFLGSYAISAAPTFTNVAGYGPGALLWFLAIFVLGYVVSRDLGNAILGGCTIGMSALFALLFITQLVWSAASSTDSERENLPYYAAKRGIVCSFKVTPLPIVERQLTIELRADDRELWLESLLHWGVDAVQIGGIEYRKAPAGSLEAQSAPYMTSQPVATPARYLLRAQGGYPYVSKWQNGGDNVRLTLIDTKSHAELGGITYKKQLNENFGFCPSLTYFPGSKKDETIKWLAPFIDPGRQQ